MKNYYATGKLYTGKDTRFKYCRDFVEKKGILTMLSLPLKYLQDTVEAIYDTLNVDLGFWKMTYLQQRRKKC